MVAKKPAAKKLMPRLPMIPDEDLTDRQRELMAAIRSGPRGKVSQGGPFGVYLHAPEYGDLVQQLGAHCRFNTAVPPRLSEFAILVIARLWRAQYEWHAHTVHGARAGVLPGTISDLKAGRMPKNAPKDERAIYDFIVELHKTKRVSDRNYARVHAFLGDAGMVELVGILGYYTLVAMTLNAFNVAVPADAKPPFAEPEVRRK
jgi:4-carboxymuconolactone decarboxylase